MAGTCPVWLTICSTCDRLKFRLLKPANCPERNLPIYNRKRKAEYAVVIELPCFDSPAMYWSTSFVFAFAPLSAGCCPIHRLTSITTVPIG